MLNIDSLTQIQIIASLTTQSAETYDLTKTLAESNSKNEFKKASVLIPFVRENDAWHILFIRRADSERDRHSGQVAFVGGKAEDEDKDAIETALRETQEEIGVHPTDVKILGQLGSHYSVSNFQITPIVAILPWPYKLTLETAEVSHTFTIPLAWLADKNNYQIQDRQPPETDIPVPVVYFNKFNDELLWGATARMILSLIKTLNDNK